jgi:hypothetical protein
MKQYRPILRDKTAEHTCILGWLIDMAYKRTDRIYRGPQFFHDPRRAPLPHIVFTPHPR